MLFDLSATPFGRLASDPTLRAALGLLKFARRRLLPREAAVQIRTVLDKLPTDDALLSACLEYLEIVIDPRRRARLRVCRRKTSRARRSI